MRNAHAEAKAARCLDSFCPSLQSRAQVWRVLQASLWRTLCSLELLHWVRQLASWSGRALQTTSTGVPALRL